MNLTDPTVIAQQFASIGLELPDRSAAVFAALTAARNAAAASPADDLRTALEGGELTADNAAEAVHAAALTAAAQSHAQSLVRDLLPAATRLIRGDLRDHLDELTEAMRPAFDEAAVAVTNAGEQFPATATAEDVLSAGPAAAAAWEHLGDARATLDARRGVAVQLATMAGWSGSPVALFLDPTTAKTMDKVQTAVTHYSAQGLGGGWHALAVAGYRLRLNTPNEATALLESAQAVAARADAAARQARIETINPRARRQVEAWASTVKTA